MSGRDLAVVKLRTVEHCMARVQHITWGRNHSCSTDELGTGDIAPKARDLAKAWQLQQKI